MPRKTAPKATAKAPSKPASKTIKKGVRKIKKPSVRALSDGLSVKERIAAYKEAAAAFMQREFGVTLDPVTEINHCIGSKTALAMLPGGSTNVFVRTLGIANDPMVALTQLEGAIERNEIERVSLGKANYCLQALIEKGWIKARLAKAAARTS